MELDLKFIENEQDLIGKEISYCYFVEDDDEGYNVVATKDKCIRIAFQKCEWDNIVFLNPITCKEQFDKIILYKSICSENTIADLVKYGIISKEYVNYICEEDNKKKQAEEDSKRKAKRDKEYKEYLRLKEKFKN